MPNICPTLYQTQLASLLTSGRASGPAPAYSSAASSSSAAASGGTTGTFGLPVRSSAKSLFVVDALNPTPPKIQPPAQPPAAQPSSGGNVFMNLFSRVGTSAPPATTAPPAVTAPLPSPPVFLALSPPNKAASTAPADPFAVPAKEEVKEEEAVAVDEDVAEAQEDKEQQQLDLELAEPSFEVNDAAQTAADLSGSSSEHDAQPEEQHEGSSQQDEKQDEGQHQNEQLEEPADVSFVPLVLEDEEEEFDEEPSKSIGHSADELSTSVSPAPFPNRAPLSFTNDDHDAYHGAPSGNTRGSN